MVFVVVVVVVVVFERFKAVECSYKVFIFHETFVTVRGENYSRRY